MEDSKKSGALATKNRTLTLFGNAPTVVFHLQSDPSLGSACFCKFLEPAKQEQQYTAMTMTAANLRIVQQLEILPHLSSLKYCDGQFNCWSILVQKERNLKGGRDNDHDTQRYHMPTST